MSYNKKTWLARLGQGLNKFIFNGGSKVTLESSPDTVTQQGTPLSAENMNDLEQRIADEFSNQSDAINAIMTRIPYRAYHNAGVSVQSLSFNVGTNDGIYLFCTYSYSNPPGSFNALCVGIIGLGEGNIGFRKILTPDSSGYNVTSVTFSNGVISLNYDSTESIIGHVFELTSRYI